MYLRVLSVTTLWVKFWLWFSLPHQFPPETSRQSFCERTETVVTRKKSFTKNIFILHYSRRINSDVTRKLISPPLLLPVIFRSNVIRCVNYVRDWTLIEEKKIILHWHEEYRWGISTKRDEKKKSGPSTIPWGTPERWKVPKKYYIIKVTSAHPINAAFYFYILHFFSGWEKQR